LVNDLNELSRSVSHALRHAPWLYELELDNEGWTSVDSLLSALRRERPEWRQVHEGDLRLMIENSDKRRHQIRAGQIRALYGHSVPGRLKRARGTPPSILFHGTSLDAVSQIKSCGIKPMGRQYVHLSVDRVTAIQVGRRKSQTPVILCVHAAKADSSGVAFYEGNERVWLVDFLPPEFLVFDDVH
jgi:putative RNA 2'-phosphotransferase